MSVKSPALSSIPIDLYMSRTPLTVLGEFT